LQRHALLFPDLLAAIYGAALISSNIIAEIAFIQQQRAQEGNIWPFNRLDLRPPRHNFEQNT